MLASKRGQYKSGKLYMKKTMIKAEKRNGLEPGCGLRNPRSGLGRVGSMKLSDNLRGMTYITQ